MITACLSPGQRVLSGIGHNFTFARETDRKETRMDDVRTAMAKLAGIRRTLTAALDEKVIARTSEAFPRRTFPPDTVGHQFKQAATLVDRLRDLLPSLYDDFQPIRTEPAVEMAHLDTRA